MSIKAYGASLATYDTWVAETEYELDDSVVPSSYNTKRYECTTAGATGENEPTWNTELDITTNDGTVVWTCKEYESAPAAVSATLDTEGYGGLPLKDVWVKSDGEVTFAVEVSYSGEDGTWRELASVDVNDREKFKQYSTAYRFIRVSTETVATSEIEIVAGE